MGAGVSQVGPKFCPAPVVVVGVIAGRDTTEIVEEVATAGNQARTDASSCDLGEELLGATAANAEEGLDGGAIDPRFGRAAQVLDCGGTVVEPEGLIGHGGTSAIMRNRAIYSKVLSSDNRTLSDVRAQAHAYIASAKSPATRRAYQSDWRHFESWCTERKLIALPAVPATVALYLAEMARHFKAATLARRLAAVNKVHEAAGHPGPAVASNFAVSETLKGIRRVHGVEQHSKRPLFTEELAVIMESLPDGLTGQRDRALLLVGFAGGLRRAELAAVRVEDVEQTKEGLIIRIPRSKTDQEGGGREVALPYGSTPITCPVEAWQSWLKAAGLARGPAFRNIDRHGNVGGTGLNRDSIGWIVKRAVSRAGLDPDAYGGHSLRAGFCTQAYMNGAREFDIMRQTGHRSLETLRRYVRGRGLFRDSAAAKLGL
jgi:integrase